jgi:hypothetical protein
MNSMEKNQEITKPYEPTEREAKALAAFKDRRAKSKPAPSLKLDKGNVFKFEFKHPDAATANTLLMESLATCDYDFIVGLLAQVVIHSPDEAGANFILSMIKGIEPRDQLETMLATQMAALHNATMTFARRLNHVETLAQQDSAERALNKLARTFCTQIETLKRYRSTGEQKMTVQHVTVNDGGQAVIGNVAGAGTKNNEDKPHAKQVTHAPSQAMPRPLETVKEAVPSPGG